MANSSQRIATETKVWGACISRWIIILVKDITDMQPKHELFIRYVDAAY